MNNPFYSDIIALNPDARPANIFNNTDHKVKKSDNPRAGDLFVYGNSPGKNVFVWVEDETTAASGWAEIDSATGRVGKIL